LTFTVDVTVGYCISGGAATVPPERKGSQMITIGTQVAINDDASPYNGQRGVVVGLDNGLWRIAMTAAPDFFLWSHDRWLVAA